MWSKTTIALEPQHISPLWAVQGPWQMGPNQMAGSSLRLCSFLSNKLWEARYPNHITSISAKTLSFLNNSGGRKRPLPTVDFLLISTCGGAVMYWKRKLLPDNIRDIEIVHSGWIKLISNHICQSFLHSLYLPLTFRMRKFKQEQKCLNSKFAREHLILNGRRFITTLLPDPININQDKKKSENKTKKICASFGLYSTFCCILQLLPTVLSSEVIKERCLLPDFS